MYLCTCGATIELDKFCKLKEPLTLPIFRGIFMGIFVKKQGGGSLTPPGKFQISNGFGFLSYLVGPSIWQSFIEIGEMAFITTAWSSHGDALNTNLWLNSRNNHEKSFVRLAKKRIFGNHAIKEQSYKQKRTISTWVFLKCIVLVRNVTVTIMLLLKVWMDFHSNLILGSTKPFCEFQKQPAAVNIFFQIPLQIVIDVFFIMNMFKRLVNLFSNSW